MRIAMIGQKRTGSREGGVEVVVGELARRMADLGHQVTCYDRMGEGAPSEPYEKDGYRIVPVKALDIKGLSALTSSFAATRAAIKDGADVIHYHAEGPCVPLRFARSTDIRTVATIHGLDWQRAKWGGLASKYIKFGEATAAKCADALIVLSRGNQEYFKEAYGREATLIPNGITPEADLPAKEISERWGLTQGSYVLYLGRIVPEKRPELLLEAYKQVKTDKRWLSRATPPIRTTTPWRSKRLPRPTPARSLPATLRATCSPSCTPTRIATRSPPTLRACP